MSRPFPPSSPPSVDRGEIARLNDLLRDQITAPGRNRVLMTRGIAELLGDVAIFRNFRKRAELLRAVRAHDTFSPANDPYGEHDLGMFVFEGVSCMWKIDYYDPSLSVGSEDPANSSMTIRVLTIMRAEER